MNQGDRVLSYVIERELGEGGMGTVYLGRHTVMNQLVAIKALSPLLARDQALRERFVQEANIQAGLRHPGIVQVLTAEMEGDQPSLVMEYIDGKSLSEVLDLRGALPFGDALKIMEQVLSAVGYAHRQGVVHRDLKPSNVMVMGSGETKVTDFGIAKVLGSVKLTRTGTAMGSPHYMSPEQIRRPESVDSRSDIYSLGCVFYEMLSGRPPFGDADESGTESDFDIKEGHIRGQATDLGILKPDLPEWLTQLVMQLLEKEADHRPASCDAVLELLRQGSFDKNDGIAPQSETWASADNEERKKSAIPFGEKEPSNSSGNSRDNFDAQSDETSQPDNHQQPQKEKKKSNYAIILIISVVLSKVLRDEMNFDFTEILIVIGCLFAGYFVISNLFKDKGE